MPAETRVQCEGLPHYTTGKIWVPGYRRGREGTDLMQGAGQKYGGGGGGGGEGTGNMNFDKDQWGGGGGTG